MAYPLIPCFFFEAEAIAYKDLARLLWPPDVFRAKQLWYQLDGARGTDQYKKSILFTTTEEIFFLKICVNGGI